MSEVFQDSVTESEEHRSPLDEPIDVGAAMADGGAETGSLGTNWPLLAVETRGEAHVNSLQC